MLVDKYGTDQFKPYVEHLLDRFEPPKDFLPRSVVSEWERQKGAVLDRSDEVGQAFSQILKNWRGDHPELGR